MQAFVGLRGQLGAVRCRPCMPVTSRIPQCHHIQARATSRFNRDLLLDNVDAAGAGSSYADDWKHERPLNSDSNGPSSSGRINHDYGQYQDPGWSYDAAQEQVSNNNTLEREHVSASQQSASYSYRMPLTDNGSGYDAASHTHQQPEVQQPAAVPAAGNAGGLESTDADDSWHQSSELLQSASDDDSDGWPAGSSRFASSGWGEVEPLSDWGGATYAPSIQQQQSLRAEQGAGDGRSYDAPGWDSDGPSPGSTADRASVGAEQFMSDAARGGSSWAPGPGGPGPGSTSEPFAIQPSDIVMLSRPEAGSVMPLAPTSTQLTFYQPKSLQERVVQYLGSLGASVVLSKAALLAAPALLFPIWNPWIRAGFRNLEMYSQTFQCVGLWRAHVLDVQVSGFPYNPLFGSQPPMVSLLIGDPWVGGARTQLELPYIPRAESIQTGDLVELIVLSRDDSFVRFKVVREVYLPQTGIWLSDYPFLNRDLFLQISLQIELERQQQQPGSGLGYVDIDGYSPADGSGSRQGGTYGTY